MLINTEKTLAASADDIWDLLAERFADIGHWATFVEKSYLDGALDEGVTRTCELAPSPVGSGTIRETITRFDRTQKRLTYDIIEGMPGFVKKLENAWTIVPAGDGRAKVTSDLTIKVAWWAAPMGVVMKRQFAKTIGGFMRELERNAGRSGASVEPVALAV